VRRHPTFVQQNLTNVNSRKERKGKEIKVKSKNISLSDDDFLTSLKTNPVYKHINFDLELGKMDVWLKERGRKKTRRFIINWLNKVEAPVNFSPKASPKADLNCPICAGKGKILEGAQKGGTCICVK
jgi:hypothetical protein